MNRERLYFYLVRLQKASPAEWFHRLRGYFFISLLKAARVIPVYSVQAPEVNAKLLEAIQVPSLYGEIEPGVIREILEGKVFSLNQDQAEITEFENIWRNHFFSDVPTNQKDPDIRTVWEPARLQHLTLVLHRIRELSGASNVGSLKKFVRDTLLAWLQKNPFPLGPHFVSVMECGLRIPVFLQSLKILDTLSTVERKAILQAIYEHAWIIWKRLSLYSSLGNHTVAECVGLIIAGAIFQETDQGRKWLRTTIRLLEQECQHQILDDGGPAEQSLSYHRFILDMYRFIIVFLEQNKLHDCAALKPRIQAGEEFWEAFQINEAEAPCIGDSDDGFAIAPGLSPFRAESSQMSEFHGSIQKRQRTNDRIEEAPLYHTFPNSGYTVLKTCDQILLTFNHGPLGMTPFFNHGHADALAITLSKKGQQILIDPGTYRYNGVPEWRKYFKGTRAHNTVTIDGLDQAVQVNSFIWSHPYEARLLGCEKKPKGIVVEAVHNGYTRLKNPVRHKRTIFLRGKSDFIIKDSFSGQGINEFEINYHLHSEVKVNEANGWWHIDKGGQRVFITLLGDDFRLAKGQYDPLLGWHSPVYGIKKESCVLHCKKRGRAEEVYFITAICTNTPVDVAGLQEEILQFE
ncbi:MAG: alginate lyase family protein [Deltaproteobacteria bacterium]|nr:alginate lyase family protein [Deltaproteobacteria bacterium]